jgi:dTDP-4-dehydrorhamnose reductase
MGHHGRVLITGAAGLLGRHLSSAAPPTAEVLRTWRQTALEPDPARADHQVDLADGDAVTRLMDEIRPDLVIHAAYDKVDLDNGVVAATRHVAEGCARTGAALVHLSSDVVFDGEHAPYDEDHPLCPVNAYGKAKARAEADVRTLVPDAAIVRTSLLCSLDPPDPVTAWVIDALRSGEPVTLFTDEVRCPARVDDLAVRIWDLAGRPRAERVGPWHLVGPEGLSRHEIGRVMAGGLDLDPAPLLGGLSSDSATLRPRDLRLTPTRRDTPAMPNRQIDTLFEPH